MSKIGYAFFIARPGEASQWAVSVVAALSPQHGGQLARVGIL